MTKIVIISNSPQMYHTITDHKG